MKPILEKLPKASLEKARLAFKETGRSKWFDTPAPICEHPDCNEDCSYASRDFYITANGRFPIRIGYKRHCAKHADQKVANDSGFDNTTEYKNSKHPYRKFRKDFCENTDGRLGFTCTTTVAIPAMLQVDHIDGNPSNNVEENLQTLCACCHIFKTHVNEDYKSPGRATLGLKY